MLFKSSGEIDRRSLRTRVDPPLTPEERTRLYCLFKPCPKCVRNPGEYCVDDRGVQWLTSYHWQRGPWAQTRAYMRDPANRERYEKLKRKIVAARHPTGDKTEEYF